MTIDRTKRVCTIQMTADTISDLTVSVGSDEEENHALFLDALPRYFAFAAYPKLATNRFYYGL